MDSLYFGSNPIYVRIDLSIDVVLQAIVKNMFIARSYGLYITRLALSRNLKSRVYLRRLGESVLFLW